MSININSKDKIGLLTENAVKKVAYSYKGERTTLRSAASSDDHNFISDTIHYLTPVSSSRSTEYEGDLSYIRLLSPLYYDDKHEKVDFILSSSSSSIPCEENTLQRTIAIIKPEAFKFRDVVLRAIEYGGFQIVHQRTLHLTPEQVSEIYESYYGSPIFPNMVVSMSTSPILVLALQAINAIDKWRNMIGPMGTLQDDWFFPSSIAIRNLGPNPNIPDILHASENFKNAQKESRYFFSKDVLEPLPADSDKVKDYLTTFLKPTLLSGLAEIVRTKPIDPITSFAEWLLLHNPYIPNFPVNVATART